MEQTGVQPTLMGDKGARDEWEIHNETCGSEASRMNRALIAGKCANLFCPAGDRPAEILSGIALTISQGALFAPAKTGQHQ